MPTRRTWVPDADTSAFPLHHLPLGARRRPDGSHAVCTRVGDYVADLRVLAEIGLFDDCGTERADFKDAGLNALIARGNDVCARVRRRLQEALDAEPTYFRLQERQEIFLLPQKHVTLVSPVRIGDYACVRSGAYAHARASSVAVSGSEVRGAEVQPQLGFVVGEGSAGERLTSVEEARRHVFGGSALVGFRESGTGAYPLPVATVMSPWVTPLEALPLEAPAAFENTLQFTPYRRAPQSLQMLDFKANALDPTAALATLTDDGVRLRPGDLIAWNASVRYHEGLSAGDAVRYTLRVPSAAGAFSLAPARATVTGKVNG